MIRLKTNVAKLADTEEQALRDILSANIKKFRLRRNWSQFSLAAKIDISTNFLADIEAGNTWVSSQTLVKLAKAFEIDVYELLKPENDGSEDTNKREDDQVQALIDRFSLDLKSVLKDSVEKAVDHIRKEFTKIG